MNAKKIMNEIDNLPLKKQSELVAQLLFSQERLTYFLEDKKSKVKEILAAHY